MKSAETRPVNPEPCTLELNDVDALIQQLEVQFQGRHVILMQEEVQTNGCTAVEGCTGSCPCPPEPGEPTPGGENGG